jgi:hypothetical protein
MSNFDIRTALERLLHDLIEGKVLDGAIADADAALAQPEELQWPASVAQGCHEAAADAESGSPLQQLLAAAGDLLERGHPATTPAPEPGEAE